MNKPTCKCLWHVTSTCVNGWKFHKEIDKIPDQKVGQKWRDNLQNYSARIESIYQDDDYVFFMPVSTIDEMVEAIDMLRLAGAAGINVTAFVENPSIRSSTEIGMFAISPQPSGYIAQVSGTGGEAERLIVEIKNLLDQLKDHFLRTL